MPETTTDSQATEETGTGQPTSDSQPTPSTNSTDQPVQQPSPKQGPTNEEAKLLKELMKLKDRVALLKGEKTDAEKRAEEAAAKALQADEATGIATQAVAMTDQMAAQIKALEESNKAARASIQTYFDGIVADLPEGEQALWKEMPGTIEQKFALLGKHKGILQTGTGGDSDEEPAAAPPRDTGHMRRGDRFEAQKREMKERARKGDKAAKRQWREMNARALREPQK